MGVEQGGVQLDLRQVRVPDSGPVRDKSQSSSPELLLQTSGAGSNGDRCPECSVATTTTSVRLPPLQILSRVVQKIIQQEAEVLLVAPHWPRRIWFHDLQRLSVQEPWPLPQRTDLLRQGGIIHPNPQSLQLTIWRLNASNFLRRGTQSQ